MLLNLPNIVVILIPVQLKYDLSGFLTNISDKY